MKKKTIIRLLLLFTMSTSQIFAQKKTNILVMVMYYEKELFIENDFKRYSIGSTTDDLKKNPDGSIDIYIQKDHPGKEKQSNWLPSPVGSFNLTMRMYGAATSVLDASYLLPEVKK